MYETTKPSCHCFHFPFLLFHELQHLKRSLLSLLSYLPTSLFAALLLFLLSYNVFTLFSIHLPFLVAKSPPQPILNSKWSLSHSTLSSAVLLAAKHENSAPILKTHLPFLQNSHLPLPPIEKFSIHRSRQFKRHRLGLISMDSQFQARIKAFFAGSSNSSCKVRFFMTWISPLEAFGDRELLTMESLFKSHPEACLVIVSKSLDSDRVTQILKPFLNNGFRVMAIAPDFNYIFKNTHAETWFNRLKGGNVNPGEIPLGQNLSNLLRLALLYKFGGIYIDADVILLKSFSKLRNTVGAQAFDGKTGKWSRLNNAVLIFDKKHPLVLKFIEEFALTFNGNKWGHNGPYLVSRVVTRVSGRPGFNFTVVPPSAFYPVDWRGIKSLFEGPRDEKQSKWLVKKLWEIRKESFAVHLWNRQSRKLEIEKGSIVNGIISSCCIFCNSAH